MEWRYAVPNAPSWSPVSKWKLPVIVVGRKQPRWGRVVWRRRVGNVVLKYQEKFLFPNAPRWSPMHKVSLRAFRVQTVGEERRARRVWNRSHSGRPFANEEKRRKASERLRSRSKQTSKQRANQMKQGH